MFRLVFLVFAAGLCGAVFMAALFIASGIAFGVEEAAGLDPTARTGAVALSAQVACVLAAMGVTFGTFAGLRWVWRGFGRG